MPKECLLCQYLPKCAFKWFKPIVYVFWGFLLNKKASQNERLLFQNKYFGH